MPLLLNRYVWAAAAALALLLGAYAWLAIHDKAQQAIGQARCEARVAEALADAQLKATAAQAAYAKQLEDAQHVYETNLDAARGRVLLKPIWLRGNNQICSGDVPTASAEAGDPATGSGATVGGTGSDSDIRPKIEHFKLEVETLVEQCRRLDAAWP